MKKSLLFFCFAVLMNGLFAQNKIWSGPFGGLWSVGANWIGGLPGPTDTAVFNSNNQCNVDIDPTIAAIRALGPTNANQLGNVTGVLRTITVTSNPATSPVLYVESGSFFTLGALGSTAGISITTYGAGISINTAKVDGGMSFGYTSSWNVANGAAVTNVDITSTGSITLPGVHTAANLFLNSTTANLRFLSGSTLFWGRNGGAIPAADYQSGSTINVTGVTSTMPAFSNAANYSGLLIWNCAGQTVSGSSAVLLPTASYSMDSIRVVNTNTGTLRITTEPIGYTLGHVEVQGGTLEMSAPLVSNRTGTITTDLKISGGTVIGNASFIGEGLVGTPMTLSVGNQFLLSGTGTINLTNRPIGVGANGAFQLNVAGDVVQTAGTITATSAFGSQNQIVLNGTLAQNLTMNTFSGPMSLAINNSSVAGVTLLSNLTIPAAPAALVFVLGVLHTSSTNLLAIAAGGQVFGAANGSYVDGPIRKFGNTAFVFPVGKPVGATRAYVPIEISATLGPATDNFTAEYKRSTAEVYPVANAGIEHVSRVDYWILDRSGSTSQVNVTLYWTATSSNGGSVNYINNLGELIIAWSNGANWINFSGLGQTTGTTTAGTITWTSLTNTFGPFSLASTTINNPLPITLNYLNGIKQNGAHYLNWKVTCFNNASATMVLERSADSRNFTAINTITADALRCEQPFDHTDNNPLAGMNYYRLKMTDANGKITYSTIIALLNKESGFDIVNLVPTLVTGNAVLNVTAAQKTKMDIVITDISGRQVQKIAYNLIAGSNQFTINLSNIGAGTYQIKGYTIDGVSRTIRFVKQ